MCIVLVVALSIAPLAPGVSTSAKAAGISAVPHRAPVIGSILRDYNPPEKRWQPGHRGVDMKATPGEEIRASADGVVHFAGSISAMTSVSILHADGIRTTYQPIETTLKSGDPIVAGQVIGRLTVSPRHPEPGLHWGALRGRDYLNPLDLIRRRRIVLKPTQPRG